MTRLLTIVVLAAFVVGCSDKVTTAPQSLHPSAASRDFGTPPPPPLTGDGFGDLSTIGGEAAAIATGGPSAAPLVCSESTPLTYHFSFVTSQPGDNMVAELQFEDPLSGHVSIHQAPNHGVDAQGIISGPGFSFRITNVNSGTLDEFSFDLFVDGVLTTPAGSCSTAAHLTGSLVNTDTE